MYGKNIWKEAPEGTKEAVFAFNKDYIDFLSLCKTERLCVRESTRLAVEKGFRPLNECATVAPGDRG